MLLASTLIFLSALNQTTLYISRPRNVKDAFICFNSTSTCENWPKNWQRLNFVTINDGEQYVMKKELSSTELNGQYKLRLIFYDKHYEDTAQWTSFNSCTSEQKEYIGKCNGTMDAITLNDNLNSLSFSLNIKLYLILIIIIAIIVSLVLVLIKFKNYYLPFFNNYPTP